MTLADQDLGHPLPLSHSPFFLLLQPHWPSFSCIPSLFTPHPPQGLCSSARASPPRDLYRVDTSRSHFKYSLLGSSDHPTPGSPLSAFPFSPQIDSPVETQVCVLSRGFGSLPSAFPERSWCLYTEVLTASEMESEVLLGWWPWMGLRVRRPGLNPRSTSDCHVGVTHFLWAAGPHPPCYITVTPITMELIMFYSIWLL